MFSTKQLVNTLNRQLKDKVNIVEHVEALIFWHRPVFSAIILGIIELTFILIYLSNFSKVTVVMITLGALAVANVSQKVLPKLFDKFFSFKIPETEPDATNRIRSVSEVSAYLTTMLSLWVSFIKFILSEFSLMHLIVSVISLFFLTVILTVLGDFWIVFLFFHVIFILPGIVLHPRIYKIVFYHINDEEEDQSQRSRTSSAAQTGSGAGSRKEREDSTGGAEKEKKQKKTENKEKYKSIPDDDLDAPPPTMQGDEDEEQNTY